MCQTHCSSSPARLPHANRPSFAGAAATNPAASVRDGVDQSLLRDLFQRSVEARETAYAPNSGFQVGAALLTRDGKVYQGSNKELTVHADHAEQSALHRALLDGQKPEDLVAIAIFGAKGEVGEQHFAARTPACGNCRQALYDLNPNLLVVGADGPDGVQVHRLVDELPGAYHRTRQLPTPPPARDHEDPLVAAALQARSRSYVPRSGDPVGAAVLTDKGVFTGAQMEVSSFASQAARMALGAALDAGATHILKMAILGGLDVERFQRPRELPFDTFEALYDLAPEATVLLPDAQGVLREHAADEFPRFLRSSAGV